MAIALTDRIALAEAGRPGTETGDPRYGTGLRDFNKTATLTELSSLLGGGGLNQYGEGTFTSGSNGSNVGGIATSGSTIAVTAGADGGFAHGWADGNSTIKVDAVGGGHYGLGSWAGGYANGGGVIEAVGKGTLSFGYVYGGTLSVDRYSYGSMAIGQVVPGTSVHVLYGNASFVMGETGGAASGSEVRAVTSASFVGGRAGNGGIIEATGRASHTHGDALGANSLIKNDGYGSLVVGRVDDGTLQVIRDGNYGRALGAWAGGYVNGSSAQVTSTGFATFVFGAAIADNTKIQASTYTYGTIVGGCAGPTPGASTIYSKYGVGSIVWGHANAGGKVAVYGNGSVTFGQAAGAGSEISVGTTATGSMAGGSAGTGGTISVTAGGSIAWGVAGGGTISVTALNAFQLGVGTNDTATSFRVGDSAGLHLHGDGAPGAPANGDIWVDGSGNVIIRSGGNSVTIA